jgi:hypothetical protein
MEAAEKRAAIARERSGLRRFLLDNSLSLAAFLFFIFSFAGQILTGKHEYNAERRNHGRPAVTMSSYLSSGAFVEATAENWESEFLQMGLFVLLTAYLYQRGSSESKTIEEPNAVDQDPSEAGNDPEAPWPVRRGGVWLTIYKNSLGGALLVLFLGSFIAHAIGGSMASNENQLQHGGATVTALGYLGTSQFWFESFQNWQSEFLAVASLATLSIVLRQRGSPESKPVAAPHAQTGS